MSPIVVVQLVWALLVLSKVDPTAGNLAEEERIVGGFPLDIEQAPHQVSIHLKNGTLLCGGSVLRSNIILTAAHCFVKFINFEGWTVRAGSSYPNKDGALKEFKNVIIHPNYNHHDYDVALVYLKGSLKGPHIKPITLASSQASYHPGKMGIVSGFGRIMHQGVPSERLLGVKVQVIDWEQCRIDNMNVLSPLTARMFCAGNESGGKDSCEGDSGGPLVIDNELVGIVSWGIGCGWPNHPGVYTNVLVVKKWILSNILDICSLQHKIGLLLDYKNNQENWQQCRCQIVFPEKEKEKSLCYRGSSPCLGASSRPKGIKWQTDSFSHFLGQHRFRTKIRRKGSVRSSGGPHKKGSSNRLELKLRETIHSSANTWKWDDKIPRSSSMSEIGIWTCLLLLLVVARRSIESANVEPEVTKDNRIVGGVQINIEDVPYQVALLEYETFTCGGSIIRPDVVLTAAHCLKRSVAKFVQVRAGSSDRKHGGQVLNTEQIIVHPQYIPKDHDYDIAVLILKGRFKFNEKVKMVRLANSMRYYEPDTIGKVSGWGYLEADDAGPSKSLQALNVPIIEQSKCIKFYQGKDNITDRMFCAGFEAGGHDACKGDSGGPFVVGSKLAGIVSWGKSCAKRGKPGVYSSVFKYRKWIKKFI
ncbi:CUB and peptidase domain-containing protein 2-like [Uranotaenia lowii]|uniref:CUB and peptidase domain-containing protein 2-like n=1 Tax=Uranotaenia lowii TaxID=190385 RepID=UPI0024784BAA|nr:CUB and peptidase domain-containing protein 2-like [Uranotaenia lowii]